MPDVAIPTRPDTAALLAGVRDLVAASLPDLDARRHDIEWKADGSPVTAADRLLEARIHAWLDARLPDLTLIGEESHVGGPAPRTGWIAVLDPIDGTENFCSGLKEWGVSLSLWEGRTHRGSLLMLPELGDHLATGDALVPLPHSRITGFSSSFTPDIAAGLAGAGEGRITGCAVYNLYNVARGAFARFVNPKGAYAWDLTAGVMLAREHGCDILIDGDAYDGSFLEPDRRYRVDICRRHDLHPR
jgi:myo-inositol-1(or 4)-monophosphatase